MYKEGINVNTVSVEKLKELPGIGENLARSILLHRELKSEFVNPEELKSILPEKVFSAIASDYNIYAVSPTVWKTRITTDPLKLYDKDFEIHFDETGVIVMKKKNDIFLIGFNNSDKLKKKISRMVSVRGFLFSVKKFFGWKIPVKLLALIGIPDYDELENFLDFFEVSVIYSTHATDFVKSSGTFRNVSRKILEGKIKEFCPEHKISDGILSLNAIYPSHTGNGSLRFAFILIYGGMKGLFLFNMGVADQKNLIHSKFSDEMKNVNFIYSSGIDSIPLLKNYCGDPFVAGGKGRSVLISDGNLIYASK